MRRNFPIGPRSTSGLGDGAVRAEVAQSAHLDDRAGGRRRRRRPVPVRAGQRRGPRPVRSPRRADARIQVSATAGHGRVGAASAVGRRPHRQTSRAPASTRNELMPAWPQNLRSTRSGAGPAVHEPPTQRVPSGRAVWSRSSAQVRGHGNGARTVRSARRRGRGNWLGAHVEIHGQREAAPAIARPQRRATSDRIRSTSSPGSSRSGSGRAAHRGRSGQFGGANRWASAESGASQLIWSDAGG